MLQKNQKQKQKTSRPVEIFLVTDSRELLSGRASIFQFKVLFNCFTERLASSRKFKVESSFRQSLRLVISLPSPLSMFLLRHFRCWVGGCFVPGSSRILDLLKHNQWLIWTPKLSGGFLVRGLSSALISSKSTKLSFWLPLLSVVELCCRLAVFNISSIYEALKPSFLLLDAGNFLTRLSDLRWMSCDFVRRPRAPCCWILLRFWLRRCYFCAVTFALFLGMFFFGGWAYSSVVSGSLLTTPFVLMLSVCFSRRLSWPSQYCCLFPHLFS